MDNPASTTESQADTPAPGQFSPDRSVPIRDGRPPLQFEGLARVRLWVLLFRPIVCLWALWRQRRIEACVNARLDLLADCRSRDEVWEVIGDPVYAVRGESCGAMMDDGSGRRPDVIECYESDGCCIDLWFKDDRLLTASGFVKPTVWDVALAGGQTPQS